MRENRIKKLVAAGEVAVGTTMLGLGSREMPLLLEYAGLDWVMIDMEHSGFGYDFVADLLLWFKATDITTIVRPPDNLYHLIATVLDAGAQGVQCAEIESADDARAIVDAVMYPPLGNRGVAFPAAGTGYIRPKRGEYAAAMQAANEQTSIVAMIESVKGLDNVDEICAVEGVDTIQPSSQDLSTSLGITGQYDHPTYRDALRKVAEACKRHGKVAKANPNTEADIQAYYELGFRVMGVRNTVVAFQDAMKGDVDRMRGTVAGLRKG